MPRASPWPQSSDSSEAIARAGERERESMVLSGPVPSAEHLLPLRDGETFSMLFVRSLISEFRASLSDAAHPSPASRCRNVSVCKYSLLFASGSRFESNTTNPSPGPAFSPLKVERLRLQRQGPGPRPWGSVVPWCCGCCTVHVCALPRLPLPRPEIIARKPPQAHRNRRMFGSGSSFRSL